MTTPLDPKSIERPHPSLLQYYFYVSLLSLPAFPLVFLQLWMRYITLRYRFDEDGVSMSWGVFFRNEVNLTYRRIQDIHLTANLIQRWMGLAKISLQTAAGSSQAEMTIEGVLQAEELRDFLYARMRGARDNHPVSLSSQDRLATGSKEANDDLHSIDMQNKAIGVQTAGSERSPVVMATLADSEISPQDHDKTLRTLEDIRDALRVLVERGGRST